MANFAKPENALKRADELINVGQKQDALQALHDLITSKRYRAWQKPLEKIMFKYLDLCVDLKRGRFAKDGLIQYRIVCQQVNVSSLEEVIKHFLHLSTEKAEQARSQADALDEALDVDDLEADRKPEDLQLSIVSGEKGKDRSDRELVTPWFKFLWETYRTVLEILRNNSKLEALYALSRSALLSELVSRGVLSCASQEVKDLFHVLEHEFHPLDLGSKIQPLLEKISKSGGKLSSAPSLPEVQLSQYVPSLEKLATLRLLQQVSKIYQTIRIESLSQLVPFFEFSVVEKISVDAVKNNFVAMKVDYMKGVVIFGNLGIESDGLKDHLAVFAESLNKVRAMLYPVPSKASKLGGIVPNLADTVEKEHKRLLARKSIIEKRKEDQERQQLEMEREEEQKRLKLQKLTEEAEQKRLAAELQERRKQRILREIEQKELEEAQALLEDTEKRMKKGKKKTLLDGEKVTKQNVMQMALTEQVKERQEMEKKLQKLAKTMDYLERAKREEAAPVIEAAYQRRLVEEREFYEREQQIGADAVSGPKLYIKS
ncbi:hypothetical protein F2Q69_00042708 [Brassica cretica]|uniref:PCI domain-containing protein n=1 Tax=Brassica cretica TaxID=69181 RepID=A0A8S9NN36_BRACR|nr:hypothetical protein F2Q69_00042708 [Brassica cretica]